eukprot:CAMPEP_0168347374 /NCGR_PEP_ID=MMETSP0213-20121227/18956_1 /TAXON_ID=151035 /ORGANISM="Euplotes harpa, Strain FSP1.4" /LENGTH=48 /DNA_ID= /DNA_START= /DNA_END= /DNA_ORIENTATION=
MNSMSESTSITFKWENTAIENLPIDEEMVDGPREVRGSNYSLVETTPV